MTFPVSSLPVGAFVLIPLLLAALFLTGVVVSSFRAGATRAATIRTALLVALGTLVWMAVTWAAASSGALRQWDRRPPPLVFLVIGVLALSLSIAFSGVGRRLADLLPLWVLVGVQGFRLPLELAMHAMYERGVMPEVMSYSGRNFDVVTGASAIVVATVTAAGLGGRRLVLVWNVVGLLLLVNVVTLAILATPMVRYFGDRELNVWVTYPPFVWLPAVMVLAALAGHLLIFRALRGPQPLAASQRPAAAEQASR
jgi:hypothetical protein